MLLLLLAACAPASTPIVLVSLDTLRADRLGCYGNPGKLTPNLDAFAAQGTLFEHAYSQTTTTAPSHASLFTSRYPSEQEAGARKPELAPGMQTLAEVLSAYGWDTAAFVAGGDLAPEMGVGRGFQTWESSVDFASLWHTGPAALKWLDHHGTGGSWLLFVHGYDAHVPYLKPSPYGYLHADARAQGAGQEAARASTESVLDGWIHPDLAVLAQAGEEEVRPRSPQGRAALLAQEQARWGPALHAVHDADIALIRGTYDGAVQYADAQFGLLMAGLQDRGVLDQAVVVVLSDHGEQLGEDGVFNHCCGVGDEESHVPLIVRLPRGEGGGRRVSGLVELVDVMPTLLELAGAVPPAGIHGASLAPALRGEPFAGRDVAWTQGGMKMRMLSGRTLAGRLVYSGGSVASLLTPELIATAALPGPSFPSAPGLDAAQQAALRDAMATWLGHLSPAPAARAAPLSDALRASLRSHGYFEVEP